MKQKHIGTFGCGFANVEVFTMEGERGGEFYCLPDSTSPPRIKVGTDYRYFWQAAQVMSHEAFEYLALTMGLRYEPSSKTTHASDTYSFFMNHSDMTQLIADHTYFMTKATPALEKAWKARKK